MLFIFYASTVNFNEIVGIALNQRDAKVISIIAYVDQHGGVSGGTVSEEEEKGATRPGRGRGRCVNMRNLRLLVQFGFNSIANNIFLSPFAGAYVGGRYLMGKVTQMSDSRGVAQRQAWRCVYVTFMLMLEHETNFTPSHPLYMLGARVDACVCAD